MDLVDRPIGLFDSGVGGLTVLRTIKRVLPEENIIYFGDTARVPYGTKSKSTIKKFSLQNVRFLSQFNIKLLVVACNSSSAVALLDLKREFNISVLGVIEPAVRKAVQISEGKIGVIATSATIESGAYQRTIRKIAKEENKEIEILVKDCPLFVPLAEEGWLQNKISQQVAQRYLSFFKDKIDVLILGCTHYPLLKRIIRKATGAKTVLIDSAKETARLVKDVLEKQGLSAHKTKPFLSKKGRVKFYVSDSPRRFKKIGERFLGTGIGKVECIKLE